MRGAVDQRRSHRARPGSHARPPSTISITSGVHCQVSTRTSEGITVAGWNTQSCGGRPDQGQQIVEDAELRVEHHRPDQRDRHRRRHHRQDEQAAQEAAHREAGMED